ncbi:spindle and centriole-associated protein 1 isoform X2 [Falco biarmicus]|uniref:spindle and centriole-associated protein 1 isoform X2 n=1 Tax=Falco biarmicus TaxID=345155 RepID=UPI0024BBFBC5|nr:spindle and centriole-associated protein 1 isoform X2 [Falco biarmicus]
MSVLRGPRPRGSGRKAPRKPAAKRDWDSTVQDLTVHRATPEDILRRHEIHKSKNKALAHLELQEKALKRKWKKQKQLSADSLEKRKLTLMREILSDQYCLQDVLERSDQVMAVAKDFGDAPRTRTGFPNVTMAPNCDIESSQGPIVQTCDPPTQLSILSESVMDSQALNEVEEEALSIYQSEDGHHDSRNFKSSISCGRLLRLLREENSLENSQLWAEKDRRKTTLSQESSVPLTPTTVSPSLDQSALNATNVVKRIHSRLQNEDKEETVDSTYTVRQVLNPNLKKQKQIAAKMKRKQAAQNVARWRDDYPANSVPADLQRDSRSSLDVLNRMIHEVEHELEEYERCTGREVQKTERSEGLAGFTLSLVNALCRLMRYLKESEMQLREKEVVRQQHEEMLNEHRELIDALTAEILLVREENVTMQRKFQQYMTVTDEQLTSLTQAFKGLPLVEPRREQSPSHFGIASKGPVNGQEKPDLSYSEPRTDAGNRENTLKAPQEELSFKFPPRPGASGGVGRSLPAHVFQPAVLLSPPRQKSRQELSSLQNVFTAVCQSPENSRRELCKERSSPSSLRTQSTTEENCLIFQRQPALPADKDLESSHEKINLSCPGDTRKDSTAEELFQNGDLLGQIAELTQQNSLIKAQLSKFRGCSEDTSDCLYQPGPVRNANPSSGSSERQTHLMVSKSLEERIAELNRQSTEARDKLLQLIDQQKSAAAGMVPPMVTPVLPPSLHFAESSYYLLPRKCKEDN